MPEDKQEIFSIIINLRQIQIAQTGLLDQLEVLQERATLNNRAGRHPRHPERGLPQENPDQKPGKKVLLVKRELKAIMYGVLFVLVIA